MPLMHNAPTVLLCMYGGKYVLTCVESPDEKNFVLYTVPRITLKEARRRADVVPVFAGE